ncbi:MAG TPA: MFS transporter [Anaerolineaceae bacterium]
MPDPHSPAAQTGDPFNGWKRKTSIFLSSQIISLFGSSLVQYAIIWHITLTTQSGLSLTISTLAGFLPQMVISLIAGVWADRYNRKLLIMLADALIAVSTLVLALLFLLGYSEVWLLYVISAIRSLGAGVQQPAVGALLPQIVPTEKLMKVNSINSTLQPILFIISPILAGAMLSLYRLEYIFFVDVVTAALAILLLISLHVPPHAKAAAQQATGYLDDFKAGVKYIHQHRVLRALFAFFAAVHVLVAPAAFLTPLLVARSFGEEVWRLTANEVTFFVGMILGGVLMTAWGGFKNRFRTIGLGCVLLGLGFFSLGIARDFYIYLAFMFLCGLPLPMFNVPATTVMQEMVEPDYMGRVFSVNSIIFTAAMPAGMLIFGPLADVVSIELLLIISGLLMALPGVWLYFNRHLHRAENALNPAD